MKKLIAIATLGMLALPAFCVTQEQPKQETKQTTTTKKKKQKASKKKTKEQKQETATPAPK